MNQLYKRDDITIKELQKYVEQHYDEALYIATLAKKFSISQRTLIRRFKSATGITPIEYIQRVRIEAAKRMFEKNTYNINEVILICGYQDGTTFRKIFKRLTGLSPSEYKQKYYKS